MCKLIDIGGTPHWIFTEGSNMGVNNVLVFKWSGSFAQVGGTALNTSGNNTSFGDSVDLTTDGTNPVAVWSQYVASDTTTNIPQIYAKKWNGSAWEAMCGGTAANVNTSRRAQHLAATWLNSTLYVAFVERATEGAYGGHALLYVRSCSGTGGTWTTLGSSDLNRDTHNGWAYKPRIANDGTDLYVTWAEAGNSAPWITNISWNSGLSQKPQVYTAKLTTGGTITYLGGSLNMDTVDGSAQYPTIAIKAVGTPVVAWREHRLGTLAQVYIKQWDGNNWVALSESPVGPAPTAMTSSFVGASVTHGARTGQ
jgi:hypothetical protein